MTKHKLIFHFICGLKLSIYHKIVQVRNDSFDYTKYFFYIVNRTTKIRSVTFENRKYFIHIVEGLLFGMKIGTRANVSNKDTKRTDGLYGHYDITADY